MEKANDILKEHSKYVQGAGNVISSIMANKAINAGYNQAIDDCIKTLEENHLELGCETKISLITEKLKRLKINI